jgi:hypothetical protein
MVEISDDIGWNEGWETIKFKKVKFKKTMDEMKAEKDMIQKVEPFKRDFFFHHFPHPYLWQLLIIGMHIGILTTFFKKKIPNFLRLLDTSFGQLDFG